MSFKKIFKDQNSYFEWRLERIKNIEKRFPIIFDVRGKKILDIGCGHHAPLSYYLYHQKRAKVYAGDISKTSVTAATKRVGKANISVFSAEKLPFKNNFFDLVYLLDILEHVKDPFMAVKEAKRVVKKTGLIFIEFSPYYGYPTGHHLYPIGFPFALLPFQIIPFFITKKIVLKSKFSIPNLGRHLLEQFKHLNKTSIHKFKKIIREVKLKTIKEKYLIILPEREINIDWTSHLPLIKEVITMSYSGVFKK
ncbi:MAG: class I SAM-dependent methyltransferase [Patescibacteria group bacterium]|nr:class I SAM-dependent methyltransferase [Patescibacteria group bacterium]